ncbi:tRNAse Z TRZ4, mitochondrial-like protein [Drosera capensis]
MVEESGGSVAVGFNRKRAEGRDGSEKPKVLDERVRTLNPTSTICYVQVLGTGMDTLDTSPAVLLFLDKQRYLFNAGEIDQIFLSRVFSETAGGLPGLLLTLAGMGEEAGLSVNIEGPSDLKYLVNAMKSFIPNAAMVHTKSFGPSTKSIGTPPTDPQKLSEPIKLVENEVVKISAILLEPCCHNSESTTVCPLQACMTKETVQFSESWGTNGKPGSMRKPSDLSVMYVYELSEIPGKFDPQKAKDLGLSPGPKYGLLQKNQSLQSDLLGPSNPVIPGPVVLIVDCPMTTHLHPSSVASMPEYERWMKRFDSAQHIMTGQQARNVEIPILKSSARLAARPNYQCPQFFPASGFWPAKCTENESYNSSSSEVRFMLPECSLELGSYDFVYFNYNLM